MRSTGIFDEKSCDNPRGRGSCGAGGGAGRLQRSFASLRCNEDKKGVPPRVEYVLEAQALKEARDDPRWRRSSPEILLHDGVGSKREDFTGGAGEQREAGAAEVFPAVSGEGRAGSGGGMRVLAGVSRGGGAGGETAGAGASAAGEGDCVGEVEERSGGLGDAGAFAALRFVAGVVEGGPGDAGAAAAGAVAGDAGTASDAVEEPGACGVASAGAAFAGDRFIRQARTMVAAGREAAAAGAGVGERVLAIVGRLQRRNSKTKSSTK